MLTQGTKDEAQTGYLRNVNDAGDYVMLILPAM